MSDLPSPQSSSRVYRYVQIAVRVAVMLLICVAGWSLMDFYHTLFSDDVALAPEAPAETEPPSPVDLQELLSAEGGWSVGDSGWLLRRVELSGAELERRFAELGPPLTQPIPESALERDLLERIRPFASGRQTVADAQVYQVALGHARGRLVTQRVAGRERVRFGQLIWGLNGPHASLFELTPGATPTGRASVEPLLPIPAGTELLARRWVRDRIAAEVIGPWPDERPLPATWEETGWSAGVVGLDEVGTCTVYRRGAVTMQVWRFSALGGAGYLLIVRGPEKRGRQP